MKAILYYNKSTPNTINKKLVQVSECDIKLKEFFNVEGGYILLATSSLPDTNYIYIEKLKRYYFVRNISVVSNTVFQLDIKCDVLESFKSSILNSKALLKVSSQLENNLFDDGSFRVQDNKEIKRFDSSVNISYDNPAIILVTLGGV